MNRVDHADNEESHFTSGLDQATLVEIARIVILHALEPDGIYISRSEAERWLNALCNLAKAKIQLNGGEEMHDGEPLVVSVDDVQAVHDRTEVQLSDGAVGDSGETNDGG